MNSQDTSHPTSPATNLPSTTANPQSIENDTSTPIPPNPPQTTLQAERAQRAQGSVLVSSYTPRGRPETEKTQKLFNNPSTENKPNNSRLNFRLPIAPDAEPSIPILARICGDYQTDHEEIYRDDEGLYYKPVPYGRRVYVLKVKKSWTIQELRDAIISKLPRAGKRGENEKRVELESVFMAWETVSDRLGISVEKTVIGAERGDWRDAVELFVMRGGRDVLEFWFDVSEI